MIDNVNASISRKSYLNSDKTFNIQDHLKNLEIEEKSGLKGIEIRDSVKSLGKDDFLKLLITQLTHQDPTAPINDQAFIAQMAQFSSLEQMKNISTGINKFVERQGTDLVGKLVSGPDYLTGEPVSGIVGAVIFDDDGNSFARVNGASLRVDKIQLVSDAKVLASEEQKTQSLENESNDPLNNSIQKATNIGKK